MIEHTFFAVKNVRHWHEHIGGGASASRLHRPVRNCILGEKNRIQKILLCIKMLKKVIIIRNRFLNSKLTCQSAPP